ncbi:MAG: hypothetical protein VXX63_06675 [Bacteroidota bacterium]|nr:hypothetical protein [Bacteroidota bacterium]
MLPSIVILKQMTLDNVIQGYEYPDCGESMDKKEGATPANP